MISDDTSKTQPDEAARTHAKKAADHARSAADEAKSAAQDMTQDMTTDDSRAHSSGRSSDQATADRVKRGMNDPSGTADEARRKAGETYKQVKREGRRKASELANNLRDKASEKAHMIVDERRSQVADQVDTVGHAARDAAQRLEQEGNEDVAGYLNGAADVVEDVRDYVLDRDLTGMAHDAGDLTRRRPTLVLGGMFLAGVAISRFLKASAHREHRRNGGLGSGSGQHRSIDNRFGGNTSARGGLNYGGPTTRSMNPASSGTPGPHDEPRLPSPATATATTGPGDTDVVTGRDATRTGRPSAPVASDDRSL